MAKKPDLDSDLGVSLERRVLSRDMQGQWELTVQRGMEGGKEEERREAVPGLARRGGPCGWAP